MISKRDRKALAAFKRATPDQQRHYAREVVENLVGEVEALNEDVQKEGLGLRLRAEWIEKDLSAAIVFEKPSHFDEAKPLIKILMTPLSNVKAQMIASLPSDKEGGVGAVKQKTYYHMNNGDCVGRFVTAVRTYFYDATPCDMKDSMLAVLNGVDKDSSQFRDLRALKCEVIPAKYAGTTNPHEAYIKAHELV